MKTLISADNVWGLWAVLTGISALSIYLEQKYKWASKLTGSIVALLAAMILSNLRIIPTDAPTYDMVWGYVVPLSIPMLIFNADLKKIWAQSGRLTIIFMLSGIGTIVGAFIAFFAMKGLIPDLYKIAATQTGSYTGGGINMVAMSDAFNVPGETVTAVLVADNFLMVIYFFVIMALPSMKFIKKHFTNLDMGQDAELESNKTHAEDYWAPKMISLKDIAFVISVSFIIVFISDEIANFFARVIPTGNFGLVLLNGFLGSKYLIMTTITVFLATKFSNVFGKIGGAQEIGTFLIHIFFGVIGVPASLQLIITQAPLYLVFCAIICFVNLIITLIFAKLFKFSIEEAIIAGNANVGGPTTAAAMAIAKGWGILIVPAILVGVLGYVVGNYYGIFVGNFLIGF